MDEQKKKITLAVAARIKYYRQMRSISQEEVALRANITPAYFGQVERGLKCPTVDTLYRIAMALEVSPAQFFSSDTSLDLDSDYSQRIQYILSRVPTDKVADFFKLLEGLVDLL